MKGKIDKDLFCLAGYDPDQCDTMCFFGKHKVCKKVQRKWPTPQQFEEEYGFNYPDDGAVYYRHHKYNKETKKCDAFTEWYVDTFAKAKRCKYQFSESCHDMFHIICACTAWGCPPADWRPE